MHILKRLRIFLEADASLSAGIPAAGANGTRRVLMKSILEKLFSALCASADRRRRNVLCLITMRR